MSIKTVYALMCPSCNLLPCPMPMLSKYISMSPNVLKIQYALPKHLRQANPLHRQKLYTFQFKDKIQAGILSNS